MNRSEPKARRPDLVSAALAAQVVDQFDDLIDPREKFLTAWILRIALHADSF